MNVDSITSSRVRHNKVVLFLDVDGVLFFDGSKNRTNKRTGFKGIGLRRDVPVDNGHIKGVFSVKWNTDLVRHLDRLNRDYPHFEIVFCTTWLSNALSTVKPTLSFVAPSRYLDFDITVLESRSANKLEAIKNELERNPSAFIWADDEAIISNSVSPGDFSEPCLLLSPDENVGLTKSDIDAIEEFIKEHSVDTKKL